MAKRLFHLLRTSYVTCVLVIANCLFFILAELSGGSVDILTLIRLGAKVDVLIWQGEYWRILSSLFLHMGLSHLLFNLYCLCIFGAMLEGLAGHRRFLLIYLSSGLISNLCSIIFSPAISTGASGAIFGIIGAFIVYIVACRKSLPEGYFLAAGAALIPFLAFMAYSTMVFTGIDYMAHLGGFIWGSFTGGALVQKRIPALLSSTALSAVAAAFLMAALRPNPDFMIKNYLFIGGVKLERGLAADSIPCFEKVLALDKNNSEGMKGLGSAYIQSGQLFKGMVIWEELIQSDPGNIAVRKNLAHIHLILAENAGESGNISEAVRRYEKCIALNPRDPRPYRALGQYAIDRGDYQRGFKLWRKAIYYDPGNRELPGLLRKSIKEWCRISLFPSFPPFAPGKKPDRAAEKLNREGENLLYSSGDYEEALTRFHQSIRRDPCYSLPYCAIGEIHLISGDYDQAELYLEESARLDAGNWKTLCVSGDLARMKGREKEAIRYYTMALSIEKNAAPACAGLSMLYLGRKDWKKAELYIGKALKLQQENPHFHLIHAGIARAGGSEDIYFKEMTASLALAQSHQNRLLREYILKKLVEENNTPTP